MSEIEWERARTGRRTNAEYPGLHLPRPRQVDEFVALEHPREHVGWLLRSHAQAKSPSASGRGMNAEKPVVRRISVTSPGPPD